MVIYIMVTAGIAHKSEYHVVTAEIDLTRKEAFGFEDDTQWVALGAEFDAVRYAQLRAGVRDHLASNEDNYTFLLTHPQPQEQYSLA